MNKLFLLLTFIFFTVAPLFSQSYLGKQRSLQLSGDDVYTLSNIEENLDKQADFFFGLDYSDVVKKAKAKGLNAETDEGTIYIDGKRFRADMSSMDQKMSVIINLENRQVYYIMHDRKEYFATTLDELKATQEKIKKEMAAQMENMKGMMENMPPEAREMMEKMSGQKKTAPPQITPTGKTKNVNGFSCKEYLVTSENEREHLWITTEFSSLRDAFYEMSTSMPGADEESMAQWDLIKDGWPVQSSTVRGNEGYMSGSFSLYEIYSLKEAKHKAGTFDPPSGYAKKTMQDMMGGMQGYPQ